jgi:indole-3-glycerol phosphate synthase/phosphoribosylanthranilate isomerase
LIRNDFSPEAIADIYGHYATAISVLTDEKFFQGISPSCPGTGRVQQPVLCKDFMIDPYQVYLARHYQADAILLMLSVLTDEGYRALFNVAKELGLRGAHRGEQRGGADPRHRPRRPGDWHQQPGSAGFERRSCPHSAVGGQDPGDRVVISESGINHRAQVAALRHHAKGFLVGSSLMAEPDLEAAVRKLVLGQNKVCGLTRPEDAAAAHQAGAVFGGLIFVAKSPRYVDIPAARAVMAGAPLSYVGVFRNAQPATIAKTVDALGLAAVQLHGDEDAAYIETLRPLRRAARSGRPSVSQAASPCPPSTTRRIACCLIPKLAARAAAPARRSTGPCWPTSIKPTDAGGGLNPDNALEAAQVGCVGLDFNSGVESAPGRKDAHKLAAAFAPAPTVSAPVTHSTN